MASKFDTAYAKINLALHVRTKRDDGYHEIESLVAFLDYGDGLDIDYAETDSLTVEGEFAGSVGNVADNLVVQMLHWAREKNSAAIPSLVIPPLVIPPLAIRLVKNLPVAAGLGGGSADAAALLRIFANQGLNVISLNDLCPETAILGADVPACVLSRPLIMRGIGEQIEELANDCLANIYAVLVNPGVAVPTGPVFKAWDQIDRGGLGEGTALDIAMQGRNDLQAPAIALCPIIGDVLDMLESTQPLLARMSGSGATCFALYDDPAKAGQAADMISSKQPYWWVRAGGLTT